MGISKNIFLACAAFILGIMFNVSPLSGNEEAQRTDQDDLPHYEILEIMGMKGAEAFTPDQIISYRQIFQRLDINGDGKVSRQEYIENSTYGNPMMRKGIFRATDRNGDGMAPEREYVDNRIITDEAKIIFQKMDSENDMKLTEQEFVENVTIADKRIAKRIFQEFDRNEDSAVTMIEFLRIWGDWAREGKRSSIKDH